MDHSIQFKADRKLRRRLRWYQIFFISLGGVVGIGFFKGSSTTLGVSGPGGAFGATIVVGAVAIIVMESICEMINIWPVPNAIVEFVRAFVDEDLGVAIGLLYWYTYCVTFSALVIAVGELADYWVWNDGASVMPYIWKAVLYGVLPWLLLVINALRVEYFGWIEFVGGLVKLAIVLGTIILMICINVGAGDRGQAIGTKFFTDGVQNNENVASSHGIAFLVSIPNAIFAYIGVELLVTTASEARDPSDLRFPAKNIGWITTLLYSIAAGVFVANVSWQDRNLPQLFTQALTAITDPTVKFPPIRPNAHAAPLIVLLRLGYNFLPGFLNACFIYSAVSCANTALYVASRQLYGLTRAIDVDDDSGSLRRLLAWIGCVDHRTGSPWVAILASMLFTYWLPFIRRHENNFIKEIQSGLEIVGAVSCVLVWCSLCVAYGLFFHWRRIHMSELQKRPLLANIIDIRKTGHLYVFQPYLSYAGALATFLVVFFFNTAAMWNGDAASLKLKVTGAFISPAVLLIIYCLKKFTRPRSQWRSFKSLREWKDFEPRIARLNDLIYSHGSSFDIKSSSASIDTTSHANSNDPPARRTSERQDADIVGYTRGDLVPSTDTHAGQNIVALAMQPLSPQRSHEPASAADDQTFTFRTQSEDAVGSVYDHDTLSPDYQFGQPRKSGSRQVSKSNTVYDIYETYEERTEDRHDRA